MCHQSRQTVLVFIMPARRACDRCHRNKQKCNFEDHEKKCIECQQSATACTTQRSQLRQGRRPKVSNLGPAGSILVWDSERAKQASKTPPPQRTAAAVTESYAQEITRKVFEVALEYLHLSSEAHKANFQGNGSHASSPTEVRTPSPYSYRVTFAETPWLPHSEKVVGQFYETYDLFMFGPTFAQDLRLAFQRSYIISPVLLHDVFTALYTTVKRARHNISMCDQEEDMIKGAISLQRLRTASISGLKDAFAVLALGQSLAAFDLLTHCIGAMSILRYSMCAIRPWYDVVSRDPSVEPVLIASVFWDTINCLIRRDIPVLKYTPTDPHTVDRMAGFCSSLLPMFYDLCVASKAIKHQRMTGAGAIDFEALHEVRQRLVEWAPHPPPNASDLYTYQEVLKLRAQAAMYHVASLLLCHRVQYPVGTHDDVAQAHAASILAEFSKFTALIRPGTGLQNVTFPVLLAALEDEQVSGRIWDFMRLPAAAPVAVGKLHALLQFVWKQRNSGSASCLFDIIDQGPDFIALT